MQAARATAWTIHTEVFEGPLDLLLHLVKKEGVDVAKLPVAVIADSYLSYIERMRDLNLSVASEYLVMAATLMHLKSLELLPRPPALHEDEEDPREALARQLREYERYRAATDQLVERPQLGRDVFRRGEVQEDSTTKPLERLDPFALLDVFVELLKRADEEPEEPTVVLAPPGLDFRSCCEAVVGALRLGAGHGELGALLRSMKTRAERVLAFIAVLEMAKRGWIGLEQSAHLGPVHLELTAPETTLEFDALDSWIDEEES